MWNGRLHLLFRFACRAIHERSFSMIWFNWCDAPFVLQLIFNMRGHTSQTRWIPSDAAEQAFEVV